MIVTFVSQCQKNSLKRTRRVLDAYANRIGDNVWQTIITEEGLMMVKKLLRKTASKNTAVSCHWIRSRRRTELMWIVGNRNQFNSEGHVPVNITEKNLFIKERFALNTEVIANLAAIAGIFHDIGKANKLFQIKLGALNDSENYQKKYEPLRHEWISLRLFQAFVNKQTDLQWLKSLVNIDNQTAKNLEQSIINYRDFQSNNVANPLNTLPPIAKMVAWLIVSHHRLPQFPKSLVNQPSLKNIEEWINIFEPCWNSPQFITEDWNQESKIANWEFPFGTPFNSAYWQTNISEIVKSILKCQRILTDEWHDNLFTQHLARLCLMLADHAESSRKDVVNDNSDRNYLAYANTDKDELGHCYLKQKLDEHNINVGKLAYDIAYELPSLKKKLKTLGRLKALETLVPKIYKQDFGWQDKAAKLAISLRETVKDNGFFGISMASTGKGKTRANARIMYALSEPDDCRFNVALGLRTLSMQTAEAFRTDLFHKDEESQKQAYEKIALLVGSQAVRDLQQIKLTQDYSDDESQGSESKESLLKDEIDLLSEIDFTDMHKIEWLKHDPKILKLLHAPILVSTIDYLIPATEGVRGGRQIAPMLRLLTSDLVLDEPDDFGSADFPALCRLVNWAGMLGSKVLISTATIMPCEAEALFEAYQTGRAQYVKANCENGTQNQVCCAWFDECNKPINRLITNVDEFKKEHQDYVAARNKELAKKDLCLRQGKVIEIERNKTGTPSQKMAETIYQSVNKLSSEHVINLGNKNVSIGLVRMANIDPMIQVAKHLFAMPTPDDICFYYCVYHGQYPLLQRSSIEQMLDRALKRHNFDQWMKQSGIKERVKTSNKFNHVFIVLATSVAEVGRDHDYDWAVVEPSSMRSLIQLAGRVQRHRKQTPKTPNIYVLSKNYKGLKGKSPCFEKPGFETTLIQYFSKDLSELDIESVLGSISAAPRILHPSNLHLTKNEPRKFKIFSELEHIAQQINLYGSKSISNYAALWWQKNVSWSGELQRLQPFRRSHFSKDFILSYSERRDEYHWQEKVEGQYPIRYQNTEAIKTFKKPIVLAEGNNIWNCFDLARQIKSLSDQLGRDKDEVLTIYTHVSLQEYDKESVEQWLYQPELGFYKLLRKDEF